MGFYEVPGGAGTDVAVEEHRPLHAREEGDDDDHRNRVADEDHVHARGVGEAGCGVVVRGDHGDGDQVFDDAEGSCGDRCNGWVSASRVRWDCGWPGGGWRAVEW